MTPRSDATDDLGPAKTKSDVAYDLLRRAIVSGEIGADEPLDENALTARYDVGRTPLREALKRLAMEQFVSWPAHSTPYVRGVSTGQLATLFEARIVLEEPAGRLAAARITDTELDRLDGLSEVIEQCIMAGQIYEAVEYDHALHLAIAESTGNRYLAQAVSHLNCGSLRLWYVAHSRPQKANSVPRHFNLVAALRSRDPDRAGDETRKHILSSYQRQLDLQRDDLARVSGSPAVSSLNLPASVIK